MHLCGGVRRAQLGGHGTGVTGSARSHRTGPAGGPQVRQAELGGHGTGPAHRSVGPGSLGP